MGPDHTGCPGPVDDARLSVPRRAALGGEPAVTELARERGAKEAEKARHILPTASTMIGISTTLIGLVKLLEHYSGPSQVDVFSGIVAILFLLSAILSYLSTRLEARSRLSRFLEQVADNLFLLGLVGITGVALLFAYEVI